MTRWVLSLVLLAGIFPRPASADGLRFEVTVAPGLLAKPTDGRLLVILGKGSFRREPRAGFGDTDPGALTQLGADVNAFAPGVVGVIDGTSEVFPDESLAKVPAGDYSVQAVFDWNPDLRLAGAPGNLSSEPLKVSIDPAKGGVVKLELTKQLPPDKPPTDTKRVKFLKFPSKLLSDFHKRPYFLRAAVILPEDFEATTTKYPLVVTIGGYGTRYTGAAFMVGGRSAAFPAIKLLLDGAGPYGDPYQVNSANNGPYGDALTRELIPHVEAAFRGIGEPYARFTTGTSTGGWVSLALQVFNPDVFNGCWSFAPDPVDFRSYERINIYDEANAYTLADGSERPAKRTIAGRTVYTVRHECQVENVLGRGNKWWVSGKDWSAWNATFGPRGDDGLPKPLWHGKTGVIDRSVVEFWRQKDLRHVLQTNWATLGPKLGGKLHIYAGEMDDYFLNEAVHRLDDAARTFNPPFDGVIRFGTGQGHGYHPVNEWAEMAERFAATKPKPGR